MRYYGGGIGHLNNTPPQQADPLNSNSDKMDVEEDEEDDTGDDARDGQQDVIMTRNDRELEEDETEEEARSGDNDNNRDDSDDYDCGENDEGGDEDEDEEPICSSDNDKEGDYGYDDLIYKSWKILGMALSLCPALPLVHRHRGEPASVAPSRVCSLVT